MLRIEELSVYYSGHQALRNVSLEVQSGEVLALIGPNGAGKSTLIRAASGVIRPRGGRVLCEGADIAQIPERMRARKLAIVPQTSREGGAFTVAQTVMLGRTPYLGWTGRPTEQDERCVAEALSKTNLIGFGDRRVAELSGGEQQRVLIARALAQSTSILLLDEPTSNLDLRYQASILTLMRSLAKDNGYAVLVALHDLNQVSLVADRVALLLNGALIDVDTPKAILTEDRISQGFQTTVKVFHDLESGRPIVTLT